MKKTFCYSINLFYFIAAFFAQREKRNIVVVHNLYMMKAYQKNQTFTYNRSRVPLVKNENK